MTNDLSSTPEVKIHESTWIGLLQAKIVSIRDFQELNNWIMKLRENTDLPDSAKLLFSKYESYIQNQDELFREYEAEEARLMLFKDSLSAVTIKLYPEESNETLRKKYITAFANAIPDFSRKWEEDVTFREGDNSLVMLFLFVKCSLDSYVEKILGQVFQIIETALSDSDEIVQAELTRGLLMDLAIASTENSKYCNYMMKNTFLFCKKLNAIWHGMRY